MSMTVKCSHNLILVLPETDEEQIKFVSQVSDLFEHLQIFPDCKFRRIEE